MIACRVETYGDDDRCHAIGELDADGHLVDPVRLAIYGTDVGSVDVVAPADADGDSLAVFLPTVALARVVTTLTHVFDTPGRAHRWVWRPDRTALRADEWPNWEHDTVSIVSDGDGVSLAWDYTDPTAIDQETATDHVAVDVPHAYLPQLAESLRAFAATGRFPTRSLDEQGRTPRVSVASFADALRVRRRAVRGADGLSVAVSVGVSDADTRTYADTV